MRIQITSPIKMIMPSNFIFTPLSSQLEGVILIVKMVVPGGDFLYKPFSTAI
jgi:hypothetical protein